MGIWRRCASFALVAVLLASSCGSISASADEKNNKDDSCDAFTQDVMAVDNPTSGGRLLTPYSTEVAAAAKYGYVDKKGVILRAARNETNGLVKVWRMHSDQRRGFTWAKDGADVVKAEALGYSKQFVQFYAAESPAKCLLPAYRMLKGDQSRIVLGDKEKSAHVASGWSADGVAFYAHAVGENSKAPALGKDEFTVAVMPDTQLEVWRATDPRMKDRANWLQGQIGQQAIKFVVHTGDIVDWGVAEPEQFMRAKEALLPLAQKVPMAVTIGNHDTAAVCTGGSACPGKATNVTVRDTSVFNKYFPSSMFSSLGGQFEKGKIDNSFHTFSAEGRKWLVLNLELWPRAEVVEWAKGVVESHPKHNVIVSTHSYLEGNGTIGTNAGGYGATSPTYLWNNLIKVYPNIKMVLSGHVGAGASRVDTGDKGNKVLSILGAFHDNKRNPTRLLRINVRDNTVTHWVYSPNSDEVMSSPATVTGLDFVR